MPVESVTAILVMLQKLSGYLLEKLGVEKWPTKGRQTSMAQNNENHGQTFHAVEYVHIPVWVLRGELRDVVEQRESLNVQLYFT